MLLLLRFPARLLPPWRLVLFLLLGPLLLSIPARATHIVGGEMDLQYVSGANYRLTLNLYFDALNGSSGALDADLTVSIFEQGSNRRMTNLVLPLTSNTLVNYTNPACSSPSLVTRKLVYTAPIALAANVYNNATGYYAAVERCCRNNGINNILAAADAGQTFYLEFPAVVRNGQPFRDSTPRIFPPLSDYACLGELFYYDFGGQDADGDSLVYEMVTPLNGHATAGVPKPATAAPQPYTEVQWMPGLSVNSQIPGRPALRIDRQTGRLTVRPSSIGLFVFGVKCSEYRDGQKIGETRRDFQLKVIICAQNAAPSLVVQPPGSAAYQPGRDTLRLRPGSNRCIRLRFTDPDNASQLSLSLSPVNFPATVLPTFTTMQGTVKGPGMPDTLVSELCFPNCFDSHGQVYLLDVIVADNGCSLPKHDTVRVAFTAVPDPNAPPQLSSNAALPLRARPGDLITFDLVATDPDNDPLTLTMTGQDFAPASLGATLTPTQAGGQLRGRFSWRVDCTALTQPTYQFVFKAAANPCSAEQAATVTVSIQIDYANTAPVLTTTLPPAPAPIDSPTLIRRPVGGVYEATFSGTDAELDPLVLSATGKNFDLAAAGMSFRPVNGNGRATAVFRWDASCGAKRPVGEVLEVTFQLQETTCRPVPQTRVVQFALINPDTAAFTPPNIFTPNGDHLNPTFTLPNLPPDFCDSRFGSIKIFSRWGNLVYESRTRAFQWDGGSSPSGVYFYLVEYTDGRKFKGPVTLQR